MITVYLTFKESPQDIKTEVKYLNKKMSTTAQMYFIIQAKRALADPVGDANDVSPGLISFITIRQVLKLMFSYMSVSQSFCPHGAHVNHNPDTLDLVVLMDLPPTPPPSDLRESIALDPLSRHRTSEILSQPCPLIVTSGGHH